MTQTPGVCGLSFCPSRCFHHRVVQALNADGWGVFFFRFFLELGDSALAVGSRLVELGSALAVCSRLTESSFDSVNPAAASRPRPEASRLSSRCVQSHVNLWALHQISPIKPRFTSQPTDLS